MLISSGNFFETETIGSADGFQSISYANKFQFRANPSVFPKAHAAINILSEIRFFDRIMMLLNFVIKELCREKHRSIKNTVDRNAHFLKATAVNQIRKNIVVDGYYIAMKNEERKPP